MSQRFGSKLKMQTSPIEDGTKNSIKAKLSIMLLYEIKNLPPTKVLHPHYLATWLRFFSNPAFPPILGIVDYYILLETTKLIYEKYFRAKLELYSLLNGYNRYEIFSRVGQLRVRLSALDEKLQASQTNTQNLMSLSGLDRVKEVDLKQMEARVGELYEIIEREKKPEPISPVLCAKFRIFDLKPYEENFNRVGTFERQIFSRHDKYPRLPGTNDERGYSIMKAWIESGTTPELSRNQCDDVAEFVSAIFHSSTNPWINRILDTIMIYLYAYYESGGDLILPKILLGSDESDKRSDKIETVIRLARYGPILKYMMPNNGRQTTGPESR